MRHRLSWLGIVVLISLGACEHKPAPRQKAAAPAAAAAKAPTAAGGGVNPGAKAAPGAANAATAGANPAAAGVNPAPAGAPGAAGAEAGGENVAQSCMQVGVRVADLIVASAGDAVMKAQLEQARADTVRSTAEACMRGKWDAGLRQCFLAASTRAELDACSARAPGPAGSRPTRGS